jgi:hypothetical protein
MNEKNILLICEEEGLYEFPDLNSKLYLHFKGFKFIGGLEKFVNLKTLWLENNRIKKIENLQHLTSL